MCSSCVKHSDISWFMNLSQFILQETRDLVYNNSCFIGHRHQWYFTPILFELGIFSDFELWRIISARATFSAVAGTKQVSLSSEKIGQLEWLVLILSSKVWIYILSHSKDYSVILSKNSVILSLNAFIRIRVYFFIKTLNFRIIFFHSKSGLF